MDVQTDKIPKPVLVCLFELLEGNPSGQISEVRVLLAVIWLSQINF